MVYAGSPSGLVGFGCSQVSSACACLSLKTPTVTVTLHAKATATAVLRTTQSLTTTLSVTTDTTLLVRFYKSHIDTETTHIDYTADRCYNDLDDDLDTYDHTNRRRAKSLAPDGPQQLRAMRSRRKSSSQAFSAVSTPQHAHLLTHPVRQRILPQRRLPRQQLCRQNT